MLCGTLIVKPDESLPSFECSVSDNCPQLGPFQARVCEQPATVRTRIANHIVCRQIESLEEEVAQTTELADSQAQACEAAAQVAQVAQCSIGRVSLNYAKQHRSVPRSPGCCPKLATSSQCLTERQSGDLPSPWIAAIWMRGAVATSQVNRFAVSSEK